MVFLTEPQIALRSWLLERIHYVPTPNMVCFGNYDPKTKSLMGVVGYDNWSAASVEMHVAGEGKRWLTREFLRNTFAYPFIHAKVSVAILRISGNNDAALKFATKLGFNESCRIPNAWDGGHHMVILTMQSDNCRWIEPPLREAA